MNIEKIKLNNLFQKNTKLTQFFSSQSNTQYKKDIYYEKKYKYIMDVFISLDEDVKKYFDTFVDILIIPMTINFYQKALLLYLIYVNKMLSNPF